MFYKLHPEEACRDDARAGEPLLCEGRLMELGSFRLGKRRLWGGLITAFQY